MRGIKDNFGCGVMILRHRDGPHIVEVMVGDESLAEAAVLGSGTMLAAFAARAALCRRSVAARHSRSTSCLLADRERIQIVKNLRHVRTAVGARERVGVRCLHRDRSIYTY